MQRSFAAEKAAQDDKHSGRWFRRAEALATQGTGRIVAPGEKRRYTEEDSLSRSPRSSG